MEFSAIIDAVYQLPEQSKMKLIRSVREVAVPKGWSLLKAGTVETRIYFIKKGIVRAYSSTPDNEITFWFGKEGQAVISMRSYVEQLPGYEDIESLEACELYELNTGHLHRLFEEDIYIANWGRKFAEQELIRTEERLIQRQFRTASERYTDLLIHHPDLVQRIQLGHIASYLGITQVSLSRIRAELK